MSPSETSPFRLTAEDVFTPWEMVGESRRDSEPHRAPLLRKMAFGSLLAGGFCFTCLVPGLIGLPLGLAAWKMARRDLDLICTGDMDTDGFHPTEKARFDARAGTILNLVGLLLWSLPAAFAGIRVVKRWQ